MAVITNVFFVTVTTLCIIVSFQNVKTDNSFGPYDVSVTKLIQCKGPKRKECNHSKVKITIENGTTIKSNVVVFKDIEKVKVQIVGYLKGREYKRMHLKSLCVNDFNIVMLRIILIKLLKLTENCVILKGTYNDSVDFSWVTHTGLGSRFIYGNYKFKTVFFSDECNYFCIINEVSFVPKKNT